RSEATVRSDGSDTTGASTRRKGTSGAEPGPQGAPAVVTGFGHQPAVHRLGQPGGDPQAEAVLLAGAAGGDAELQHLVTAMDVDLDGRLGWRVATGLLQQLDEDPQALVGIAADDVLTRRRPGHHPVGRQ